MPARQRFRVELKDGDTTVVSWKKLVTDVEGRLGAGGAPSGAPAGANTALEARIAPEKGSGFGAVADNEDALPEVPNRFSSVIERIERLYKEKSSPSLTCQKQASIAHVVAHSGFSSPFAILPPPTPPHPNPYT